MSEPGAPSRGSRPLVGWRRWAAAILPFVFLARAVLMVFQIHDEHARRHAAAAPSDTSPHAGQVLRFGADVAGLRAWAAQKDPKPFLVESLSKAFLPQPPATGCLLDPPSMVRHGGGSLTLQSVDGQGAWTADWSGGRTVPDVHDTGADRLPDAKVRMNAALLAAMDCGSSATVRIRRSVLRDLLDILAGRPPTPPDPADKGARLTLRPDASALAP